MRIRKVLYYTLPSAGVVTIPTPQLQAYILGTCLPRSLPLYQTALQDLEQRAGMSRARYPSPTAPGALQDGNSNLGCGVPVSREPPARAAALRPTVPCGESWAESGSNTNKEHLYTFRVDQSITDKQKIYVRLKHDDGFQPTSTDLINTTFNDRASSRNGMAQ